MAESSDISGIAGKYPRGVIDLNSRMFQAYVDIIRSKLFFWMGMFRYSSSFINPSWLALDYF